MNRSFSEKKLMTAEEWLAAAEQFITARPKVELWEPKPCDHTQDGTPILRTADWLRMSLRAHDRSDPMPAWLKDFPLPIRADDWWDVAHYLAKMAEDAASDAQPLGGSNNRRMSTAHDLQRRIRAAATEDQYRGMRKKRWKAELAERFGVSTKTIHRHLGGMEPPP